MTAKIFPNKPFGSVPTTVLKTFNFLKTLPDGYKVWHHITPWQENKPDFLIINPDNRALIIKVSNATPLKGLSNIQMLLTSNVDQTIGENEAAVLIGFLRELELRVNGREEHSDLIKCIILLPNFVSEQITQLKPQRYQDQIEWFGKEYLDTSNINQWEIAFSETKLDDNAYQHVREMFTPEVIVPSSLTVRQQTKRNIKAGLEGFLLDYDQENVLKNDLELPEDISGLSKDFQISLINGVAGSGKTLILLYRLRLLCELYPRKRFLVLTHNRALIRDIQWKYYHLTGDLPSNIEWKTFYGWLYHNWSFGPWKKPIYQTPRDRLIGRTRSKYFTNSNVTNRMVRSEIDWINDQVNRSRNDYLSSDRRGRGFRLSQRQRNLMYDSYESYVSELDSLNEVDWGIVPHLYWDKAKNKVSRIPKYDVLLIDEGQFFAPIWFKIVRSLISHKTGHIFIAADPTQGFLNRGVSWKSMGIEVRGRSFELKRSYRTTKEIMSLANVFYRMRIPSDDSDEAIIEPDTMGMPEGVVPQLIPLLSHQDEIARVANEVEHFIEQGIPKNHILILHANWQGADNLIKAINRKLGYDSVKDPSKFDPGDYIRVTNLNRSTGIESPIVFFVGMKQLMEEEQSLRISDEEREMVIFENTRKIYMAMTRAGQRLVITFSGELPDDLKWLF